jgi:hypothetical protein
MQRSAVALIPGFLGFEHRGSTAYFTDRFTAGLGGVLTARGHADMPIFPLATLPIGSLAVRQKAILDQLDSIDRSHGPFVWHLVGHSAGGLDAALLVRTQRLRYEKGRGSVFGSEALAEDRIQSVTTISAPHYGTGLALSALACLTRKQRVTPAGIRDLMRLGADLLGSRDAVWTRLHFALATTFEGSVFPFVCHLFFHDKLATDLTPAVASALTNTPNRRGVPIFCIASMAPPPGAHPPDGLFRDLWRWTARGAVGAEPPPPKPHGAPTAVAFDPATLPSSMNDLPPEANDGVVNTARQIDAGGTYGGIVIADHADVIGSYRRFDAQGRLIEPGLLTSAARFGDEQFSRLLALVAAGILGAGPRTPC